MPPQVVSGVSALPLAGVRVLHARRLHLEAHDARAVEGAVLVVLDGEEQVVVQVGDALGAGDVGRAAEAEREAEVVDGDRLAGFVSSTYLIADGRLSITQCAVVPSIAR